MTKHERPKNAVSPKEKVYRPRLTEEQICFLIHVCRAYAGLRGELEVRHQTELSYLRKEFRMGGGYQILKAYEAAFAATQDFDLFHPMSIGNTAVDFAEMLERIVQGGRPHRTWKYRSPMHYFETRLPSYGTRSMNRERKHNIKLGNSPKNSQI